MGNGSSEHCRPWVTGYRNMSVIDAVVMPVVSHRRDTVTQTSRVQNSQTRASGSQIPLARSSWVQDKDHRSGLAGPMSPGLRSRTSQLQDSSLGPRAGPGLESLAVPVLPSSGLVGLGLGPLRCRTPVSGLSGPGLRARALWVPDFGLGPRGSRTILRVPDSGTRLAGPIRLSKNDYDWRRRAQPRSVELRFGSEDGRSRVSNLARVQVSYLGRSQILLQSSIGCTVSDLIL